MDGAREVTLRLPTDLYAQLQALAEVQGQPLQDVAVAELRRALAGLGEGLGRDHSSALHLTSPVIGLVEGILSGETTIGEALRNGDFGLGTLNKLDGEVVVLDGVAYQQGAEGAVRVVNADEKTPFMTLTHFKPERCTTATFTARLDWPGLLTELEQRFPSPNLFYAVRVEGRFESMRTRSVRKQETNRPLVAVAKDQMVFELGAVAGCLVGFWSPSFVGHALTVPGFHLHFLSDDKQQGGHVLEAVLLEGQAQIQALHHAETDLPRTRTFMGADLTRDPAADLESAEK